MKQFVKLAIGCVIYLLWQVISPRRVTATRERLFASHGLSFLERQVVAFILATTPQSTKTASEFWASNAGSRFHSNSDHRLTLDLVKQDNFYRRPMLDRFAALAAESLGPAATIIEVGCGAGGNLLYLQDKLNGRGFAFRGYDINDEVIASNRQYNGSDLLFETRNCFTTDVIVPGDLGVISCAVLMYVQEADIRQFLQKLTRNNKGRLLVGISEPVVDPDAANSADHNNLALTHGYRRIFTAAGFQPLFESVLVEENKGSHIYHAVFELAR
jgi:hypothetical protein